MKKRKVLKAKIKASVFITVCRLLFSWWYQLLQACCWLAEISGALRFSTTVDPGFFKVGNELGEKRGLGGGGVLWDCRINKTCSEIAVVWELEPTIKNCYTRNTRNATKLRWGTCPERFAIISFIIFTTLFASSEAGCLATQSTPPSNLKPRGQETGAADMNQTHRKHVRKKSKDFIMRFDHLNC